MILIIKCYLYDFKDVRQFHEGLAAVLIVVKKYKYSFVLKIINR